MQPTDTLMISTTTPAACAQSEGSVERLEYPGVAIPEQIPLAIYLPPCYGERAQQLSALYLLHGYPFDENHWIDLGVVELVDRQIIAGEWPPMMMIMPRQPEPLFRSTDGGPGSYEQEFIEGLLPFIESSYQVASSRAILGISRGGIWALEIGFRNPQLFNAVGAFSPALALNYAAAEYDPFELAISLERMPDRILLLYGETDWAKTETVRLSDVMLEMQIAHTAMEVPGGHVDSTWARALHEALAILLESTP
jgi:enterochelin esterase-like enzyme